MEESTILAPNLMGRLPDHTELPDEDGSIVTNFQEMPQTQLLTESLRPVLDALHPDGQYCIGADNGIYWRYTDPPLDGCRAPDWFYIPGVPQLLNGKMRRSYVLWQEVVRPMLVIEYASGNGSEERDTTPYKGKFWVYEKGICANYYAIFEVEKRSVEVHHLEDGSYRLMPPNEAGRFLIAPMGIELGIWEGNYQHSLLPWLRVWDARTKQLLPSSTLRAEAAEALSDDHRKMLQEEVERAENERKRADKNEKDAKEQRERANKLAEQLRALGINPDA